MSLANSLRKVSSKLVSKFGGEVIVRYVSAGGYNTATGTVSESSSDTDVRGVIEGVSLREVNDLIQAEDRRLTVAANDLDTAPGTKDRVVINTVVYQIISVNTIEQDNTPLTYELILRS